MTTKKVLQRLMKAAGASSSKSAKSKTQKLRSTPKQRKRPQRTVRSFDEPVESLTDVALNQNECAFTEQAVNLEGYRYGRTRIDTLEKFRGALRQINDFAVQRLVHEILNSLVSPDLSRLLNESNARMYTEGFFERPYKHAEPVDHALPEPADPEQLIRRPARCFMLVKKLNQAGKTIEGRFVFLGMETDENVAKTAAMTEQGRNHYAVYVIELHQYGLINAGRVFGFGWNEVKLDLWNLSKVDGDQNG